MLSPDHRYIFHRSMKGASASRCVMKFVPNATQSVKISTQYKSNVQHVLNFW